MAAWLGGIAGVQAGHLSPPPALRLPVAPTVASPAAPPPPGQGAILYSIGDPTAEEQLYLELINRCRAAPSAEAVRLASTTDPEILEAYQEFSVDLALMKSQFNAIAPAPPLAMNPRLLTAARLHSEDMLAHAFQGHSGSDGSTLGSRLGAQQYPAVTGGENVFAYARSVLYGHAGFCVDWGGGTGGMQTPPGHRNNIVDPEFREVGVGVVLGSNGAVGPQLVTQDFGSALGSGPFLTGVAYYDLNQNGAYDAGEGLGGVTVTVQGVATYAVTATAGGYALPLPGDGSYTVTFSAAGMPGVVQTAVVSGLRNVKLDFAPPYVAPAILGGLTATVGVSNRYYLAPLGAVSGYQREVSPLAADTDVEGAENGLGSVMPVVTAGYNVVDTGIKAAGKASFHLAHPQPPMDQVLTLDALLIPAAASQLTFQSRLGFATPTQVARVQISADDGVTWSDLWSRAGNNGAGQAAFSPVSVSLSDYAGRIVQLRWLYDYTAGTSFYDQVSAGTGWYFDSIAVSGARRLGAPTVIDHATAGLFDFVPLAAGSYSIRERAAVSGRFLPWGPVLVVDAGSAVPATVHLGATSVPVPGTVQVDFQVANRASVSAFRLLSAAGPEGPWLLDPGATFSEPVPGVLSRMTRAGVTGGGAFFRIWAY